MTSSFGGFGEKMKIKEKWRRRLLIACIIVLLILTEHIIHSFLRSQNYFKAEYSDPIEKSNSTIEQYNESDLTEEEFNKLFYGEESEEKESK